MRYLLRSGRRLCSPPASPIIRLLVLRYSAVLESPPQTSIGLSCFRRYTCLPRRPTSKRTNLRLSATCTLHDAELQRSRRNGIQNGVVGAAIWMTICKDPSLTTLLEPHTLFHRGSSLCQQHQSRKYDVDNLPLMPRPKY